MTHDSAAVYREEIVVPATAIDLNGHVNNVVFVQWMQDLAVRHFGSIIPREIMVQASAMWVVRSHHIEYFSPAFANDRLLAMTWVVNFGRVRSLRRYKLLRASDGGVVIRGETDWVFVNSTNGRPCSIPAQIRDAFTLVPGEADPV